MATAVIELGTDNLKVSVTHAKWSSNSDDHARIAEAKEVRHLVMVVT